MARVKSPRSKAKPPRRRSPTTKAAKPKASTIKAKKSGEAKPTKTARAYSQDILVLYEALKYGTDGKVDHAAVASATGINTSAARMRYFRLMKRIEDSLVEDQEAEEDQENEEDMADKEDKEDMADGLVDE